jgi:hypothetical protein
MGAIETGPLGLAGWERGKHRQFFSDGRRSTQFAFPSDHPNNSSQARRHQAERARFRRRREVPF